MKRKRFVQIVFVLSLVIIFSSCRKTNITTINVEVRNIDADSLCYYISKDGISAYSLWQWSEIALDSNKKASIEIETPELNSILLDLLPSSPEFRNQASLFIKGGEEYSVKFDTSDSVSVRIGGEYCKGQQFLTDYRNAYYFDYDKIINFCGLIYSDTLPESILDHFFKQKESDLNELETIYKNKGIDKDRYKAIESHIDISRLNQLFSLIAQKARMKKIDTMEYYNNAIAYPVDNKSSDFRKMYAQLFNEYPYDKEYFKLDFSYQDYLNSYLWFKSLDDSLSMSDSTEELLIAEKYLDPFLFELYFALKLCRVSLKEPFEAVEMRYDNFKSKFPESDYIEGIEKMIPRLRSIYHQFYPPDISSDSVDLNSEVILVNNYKEIESLEQIIEIFKGKLIYIDFWASWCAPCLGEFEYASQVHEFADKHNIVMLYISTDKQESNWIRALNTYKLKGYHARTENDSFSDDLDKYEIFWIPRYMIVNKDGLIVEAEAKRPSSGEELYEQLLQYVK